MTFQKDDAIRENAVRSLIVISGIRKTQSLSAPLLSEVAPEANAHKDKQLQEKQPQR